MSSGSTARGPGCGWPGCGVRAQLAQNRPGSGAFHRSPCGLALRWTGRRAKPCSKARVRVSLCIDYYRKWVYTNDYTYCTSMR